MDDREIGCLIDSHCHLADEAFEQDLAAVVTRAKEAGLESVLCILAAGDAAEAARADRLRALWPAARFSAGVHPHQARDFAAAGAAAAAVRDALAGSRAVCAIGEIGLDYHYDFSPRELQQAVFREQVRLARELRLPVIVHTREATADTFAILREEGGGALAGVFHCFTGDRAMAQDALALGFHLSFAGIVTFPKAAELREVARQTPADRLLVETDAPFLAPVPHRGLRNEPAFVARVVDAVAAARGEPPEATARAATRAFGALFGYH
jgi:TatD DNase family protein